MRQKVFIWLLLFLSVSCYDANSQQFSIFNQQRNKKKSAIKTKFPDLLPIKVSGKWGYIDRYGQIKVEPMFDYASDFCSENYAIVSVDKLQGIVNDSGKFILNPYYKKINILNKTYFAVSSDSLYGIQKVTGEKIINEQFNDIQMFSNNFFITTVNGFLGLVNREGKIIIPNKYNFINKEDSSFFKVVSKSGTGLYSESGQEVMAALYEDVNVVNNKIILFKNNSNWGAVNKYKDTLFSPVFDKYTLNKDLIIISRGSINTLFSIRNMQVIFSSTCSYGCYDDDFIYCYGNKKMGAIDFMGKILVDTTCSEVMFKDGYFLFYKNNYWGLNSLKGKSILEPIYDVISIADNNIIKVYKNRKWGLVNSKGKVIYGTTAQGIDYIDRTAKIYENKKLTIIEVDNNGNEIDRTEYDNVNTININYRYNPLDTLSRFNMNRNRVTRIGGWFLDSLKNRWGLLDSTGNIVIPSMYKKIEVNDTLHLTMVSMDITDMNNKKCPKYGIVNHETYKTIAPVVYDYISFKDLRTKDMARAKLLNNRLSFLRLNSNTVNKRVGFTDEFRGDVLARVNYNGYIKVTDSTSCDIIDNYNNYYFSLYGFYPTNVNLGNKKFIKCTGGRWGFVDYSGSIIVADDYNFVSRYINKRFIGCKNDKWGVASITGNVINFEYDYISRLKDSNDSLFKLQINVNKTGLMNNNGHILTPCKYDEIFPFFDGLAKVRIDRKFGFINEQGYEIISSEFAKVGNFSEGLAPAKMKYKWGFIDESGKFVLEAKYMMAYGFHEGLAGVCVKSKYGYIDKSMNVVIPYVFSNVSDFYHGRAVVKNINRSGIIDNKGEWVLKPKYKKINNISGYNLFLAQKKKFYILDFEGKVLTKRKLNFVGKFNNDFALVRRSNKYGYVDTTGKMIIPFKYSNAKDFSDNAAAIKVDSLWGYIDTEGEIIIEPAYTKATSFSNGRAVVFHNGNYEIIDKSGAVVKGVKAKLSEIKNNVIIAKDDKNSFYIDTNGENKFKEKYKGATNFNNNHAFVLNSSENKKEYEFIGLGKNEDNYWAIINNNGEKITGYYFSSLKDLCDGYIIYKAPTYYGIANYDGKFIIPTEYESVEYQGRGLFKVVTMNKIGYLKSNGEWIWKPSE